jgi:hypothetical protein
MAEWTQRVFPKSEIDKAAARLVSWWTGEIAELDDLGHQAVIVQNWRTSHGFPLNTFQMLLRTRAKRVDPKAVIAQRLKRFSSIMNKLTREPHMRLTQMQDLGGCRAILADVASVYRLAHEYGDGELLITGNQRLYDYIKCPKDDGYRSFHIVDRYWSDDPKRGAWNGHKIEIQLRSQLQHAFATAVETVTTFTKQKLKFGGGSDQWRRFFSLVGSALALRERTSLVAGTPQNESELLNELRELAKELKVEKRLRGWRETLKLVREPQIQKAKWLLLVLDTAASKMTMTPFADREAANQVVAGLEKSKSEDIDAVLVWVDSFRQLRKAYPNYYADTEGFLSALGQAIRK